MYPIEPPVSPMLAKLARELPTSGGKAGDFLFEPKWDGFRAIVFRDGDDVEIGSRNEKPLTRYFPDLLDPLREQLPARCVVDGEIVIATDKGLDFDLLSLRIHPAASRVAMLAEQTPASFVAFDLLADERGDLRELPFRERRRRLEGAFSHATSPVLLTPATTDRALAEEWFERFEGAGLDGVVAKPLDGTYEEGKRTMQKVKHLRTADCVVGGFRYRAGSKEVGSLLLGLYDEEGKLDHVGFTATIANKDRAALTARLEGLVAPPGFTGKAPGGQSRWSTERSEQWQPLKPKLVVEVSYDQVTGNRFRHGTKLVRFRPDKAPRQCTFVQIALPAKPDKLVAAMLKS